MPGQISERAVRARSGRRVVTFFLLATAATPLRAGQAPPDTQRSADPGAASSAIIVVGRRFDVANVTPERQVDSTEATSYGLSTVGELIDEIMSQNGEGEDPVVLVNGQRVSDIGDIADYPVEALAHVDVLPRGTGARVGASAQRRVYNIVLKPQVSTLIATAAYKAATEGHWSGRRGEAIFTRIKGPDRLNILIRGRDEDRLLESDRGIVQPAPTLPYDLTGNIFADPRSAATEIDSALSVLAGRTVTQAAIPAGVAHPTLGTFVTTAGTVNVTDLGRYRTLRPSSDDFDLSISAANRLAPWLSSSVTARLNSSESRSLLGLPQATFILGSGSPFSPFSRDVGIAVYGVDPLRQRYRSSSATVTAGLNANVGDWLFNLSGNYNRADRRYTTDRQNPAQLQKPVQLDASVNPFAGGLGDLLSTAQDKSRSLTQNGGAQLTATAPLVRLPAGKAIVTFGAGFNESRVTARTTSVFTPSTSQSFHRSEQSVFTSAEIPIASRRSGFLPALGELRAHLEYGRTHVSNVGTLTRYTYGLNWDPISWIHLLAAESYARTPADPQFILSPLIVTPGVRYFDFLSGQTVDVTQIYGGNPSLLPQTLRTRRLALNVAPMPKINLQLNVEYSLTTNRNFLSGLPPASEAVLLAFPDRFLRDANGLLTTVDARPVNFDRQRQEQIQYGFNFTIPIGAPSPARRPPGVSPGAPGIPSGLRPRLQATLQHVIQLRDDILIRPGFPLVDLLSGGAIGLAGGRARHQIQGSLGVTAAGMGARLTGSWRSANSLALLTNGVPGSLRFSPFATFNLTTYVDTSRLFPQVAWLKGGRITLNAINLLDSRQRVVDASGVTPLRYQRGYRDSVGRTVEIEFRKTF